MGCSQVLWKQELGEGWVGNDVWVSILQNDNILPDVIEVKKRPYRYQMKEH